MSVWNIKCNSRCCWRFSSSKSYVQFLRIHSASHLKTPSTLGTLMLLLWKPSVIICLCSIIYGNALHLYCKLDKRLYCWQWNERAVFPHSHDQVITVNTCRVKQLLINLVTYPQNKCHLSTQLIICHLLLIQPFFIFHYDNDYDFLIEKWTRPAGGPQTVERNH